MPNVTAVLNEQIRRQARREVRLNTKSMKKATGKYRREIAALKRQVVAITRQMAILVKKSVHQVEPAAVGDVEKYRFRRDGLKTHRAKLGLSAKDYGKLVGVSGLTIYHWEGGKTKPRQSQIGKLAAVRGIGKREASQRLGISPAESAEDAGKRAGKRQKFAVTGEQAILKLLEADKSLMTSDINRAWKGEGRAGTADVLLGKLAKARKLKRAKVKGQRGSAYSLA
jgi:DNA-binding XRE family transcriptional regulator